MLDLEQLRATKKSAIEGQRRVLRIEENPEEILGLMTLYLGVILERLIGMPPHSSECFTLNLVGTQLYPGVPLHRPEETSMIPSLTVYGAW